MKQEDFPTAQEIRAINCIANIDKYLQSISNVIQQARTQGTDSVNIYYAETAAERIAITQLLQSKGFTAEKLNKETNGILVQW